MNGTWTPGWYARLCGRIRARGFHSAAAFVESQPTASLVALANVLGEEDVAATQLLKVLLDEAHEQGTLEACARGLLVRDIHEHLPEGWHAEWDDRPLGSAFRRAGALGAWWASVPDPCKPAAWRICLAVKALPIPAGWLPADADDPWLIKAFRHWDEPVRDDV